MARHGKKRRGHDDHGEHVDERWLVTFADLMVLLFALFMILWSISSVNTSKFESLQRSLSEAFSGKVVPGGHAIMQSGGANNIKTPSANEPFSSLQPSTGGTTSEKTSRAAAEAEERSLKEVQRRIEAIARREGISGKVQARLTKDGLFVRVLTDDLLFDSGSATVKPQSERLLGAIGRVFASEGKHPVRVEGHTDNVPVSGLYPSNWELSGARAAGVARAFIGAGVRPDRLTASGRADLDSIATNGTDAGRTLNRRVEILLPRMVAMPKLSKKSSSIPSRLSK
jgi:chemotaxis protein MotB